MPTSLRPERSWAIFVNRCLQRRLGCDDFTLLSSQLYDRSPLHGIKLTTTILSSAGESQVGLDPLIRGYLEVLLDAGFISAADVLLVSFKGWFNRIRSSMTTETSRKEYRNGNPDVKLLGNGTIDERALPVNEDFSGLQGAYETQLGADPGQEDNTRLNSDVEAKILDLLARGVLTKRYPTSQEEARRFVHTVTTWLKSAIFENPSVQYAMTTFPDMQVPPLCDALGLLALVTLESPKIQGIIQSALSKESHRQLSRALTSFIPFWSQSSPRLAPQIERLQHAQSLLHLLEEPEATMAPDEANAELAASLQLQSVIDLPLVNSRASMFILVQENVEKSMIFSDMAWLNLVQALYKGQLQTLAVDLVVAGFNNLAAAMRRGDTSKTIFSARSFVVNKVPSILQSLSARLLSAGTTPQLCLIQALSRVDPNVFPAPSMEVMSETAFSDIRQDFVFACVLHNLLPIEGLGGLLGEEPMTAPPNPATRLTQMTLLQQCKNSPEKVMQLVKDLESLDGNGGTISAVLTDMITDACDTRDTMFLKKLCGALTLNVEALDALFSFATATTVLLPLLNLLDTWQHEEDQGEYQPAYEEFASILFFVITTATRFDLSPCALGLTQSSSLTVILGGRAQSCRTEDLTDEQSQHLSSWVKGLFDTDGITDDVMSHCPPQAFYSLIPTIFEQTIYACTEMVLTPEAIRNGLEYLLEPFLLPSLVIAIRWLAGTISQRQPQELPIIFLMLQRMMKAPTSSEDAKAMHDTLLSIASQPLIQCLERIRKKSAAKLGDEIDRITTFLKPRLLFRRTSLRYDTELRNWLSTPGSLRQALEKSLQSITAWDVDVTLNPAAPVPRQWSNRLTDVCVRIAGASPTLRTLVGQIKLQTTASNGAAATYLDVVAAMICAEQLSKAYTAEETSRASRTPGRPHNDGDVDSKSSIATTAAAPPSLWSALQLYHEATPSLVGKDIVLAETVVRLHRRVEDLLTTASSLNAALEAEPLGSGTATGNVFGTTSTDPATLLQNPTAIEAHTIDLENIASGLDISGGVGIAGSNGMDFDLSQFGNTEGTDVMQGLLSSTDQNLLISEGEAATAPVDLSVPSNDDDVFAGLDMGADIDFGF